MIVVLNTTLIRSDGKWPLGRVTEVQHGTDGLVWAATVKTSSREYQRSIIKLRLIPLTEHLTPYQDDSSADDLEPTFVGSPDGCRSRSEVGEMLER